MNAEFRFDLAKKQICYLTDEGESAVTFDEALRQINLFATNPAMLQNLDAKMEERIVEGKSNTSLEDTIQIYMESGFTGAFFSFLYRFILQYAFEHNKTYMEKFTLRKINTYVKKNVIKGQEQLPKLLAAFSKSDQEYCASLPDSFPVIRAAVHGEKIYYSSDYPVVSFLAMFRDVLYSMHLTIHVCTVCGEVFCGTKEDTCCGSADCRQYLEAASPTQKKDDLADISRKFSNRVRKHRSDIRDSCYAAGAVLEFDAYAKPKQAYVVEKVKELRANDAPVKDILMLKKEIKRLYKEMNNTKIRIIAKYQAK